MPNALFASFDSQLIKGEILQYLKLLIASTENKHIFTVHPQEKKTLKHHILQTADFIYWKNTSRRTLFKLSKRTLSRIANQILCHPGLAWHTQRKLRSLTRPAYHLVTQSKAFLELKQATSDETAFSRFPDHVCGKFTTKTLMMSKHLRCSPVQW